MSTPASIQITTARADSLHSVVQGRANPKRLAELAEMLAELRDWAWLEAKVETEKPKQDIWLQVRDWANGAAAQKKLNLDSVPVALKQHTANAGMESLNGELTHSREKP
jgi:hypothetical protein